MFPLFGFLFFKDKIETEMFLLKVKMFRRLFFGEE